MAGPGLGWNLSGLGPQEQPSVPTSQPAPSSGPQTAGFIPFTLENPTGGSVSFQWLPGSEGSLPPNALIGGKDVDGESLYIGRARHGGGLIPGKMKPRHRGCYVGHSGKEHLIKHYEVLCNVPANYEWKESRKDEIPPGAVEAGYSETGEKLYIGRIKHKESMCLGKVHPSHKCLYIVFGGKEIAYKAYQIFTIPK